MATGVETRIAEALFARLASLVLSPAVPVAWPGRDFRASGAYLRPSFLPAATAAFSVRPDGTNEHRGLLQVDVFWPEDKGLTEPMERASEVIAHFKRGTTMYREGVKVRVVRPPYPSPALQEPGWLQVTVSIPYLAFVAN